MKILSQLSPQCSSLPDTFTPSQLFLGVVRSLTLRALHLNYCYLCLIVLNCNGDYNQLLVSRYLWSTCYCTWL